MKSSKYIVAIGLNCFNHLCIVILEIKEGKKNYYRGIGGSNGKKLNSRKRLSKKVIVGLIEEDIGNYSQIQEDTIDEFLEQRSLNYYEV